MVKILDLEETKMIEIILNVDMKNRGHGKNIGFGVDFGGDRIKILDIKKKNRRCSENMDFEETMNKTEII